MIKGNTLYFGFGDISVSSNSRNYSPVVVFTNIKPPCKCGDAITKEMRKNIDFYESISITMDDYDLYNLLCCVNENNKVIEYNQYTFDFTNFNEQSVRVCMDGVKNALLIHQLSLAC